jgi:hypothetical protein
VSAERHRRLNVAINRRRVLDAAAAIGETA